MSHQVADKVRAVKGELKDRILNNINPGRVRQMKTQSDDRGMGRKAGGRRDTASERQRKESIKKQKKPVLNVPSKSRAEQRPLGSTVLSSSMSNSGEGAGIRVRTRMSGEEAHRHPC